MAEWSLRHAYTEEEVKRYAPVSGGVYRLYESREMNTPFYVGKSDNLERRLLEHLSPSEPDECIKRYLRRDTCCFDYAKVDLEFEMDRVEEEQIARFNPECNG